MLPVLRFVPALLPKPWGGDALWRSLRKGGPGDTRMGESWEVSDRPEAPAVVADGPYAGKTFPELLEGHAGEILGPRHDAPGGFPLLYKFIAAREKLSVQVHPGSGSLLGEAKTECWYVVDALPGASLIVGAAPGTRNREETLAALKSPACEEVLQRLPARRGDVFLIPAGTVHAITEGFLLYEIQQNSDTTFRLYDWGRVDDEGRPRALHLEEAATVADTEARDGYRIPPLRLEHATYVEDALVACRYFALFRWSGFAGPARLETHGEFRVVSVTAGAATLTDEHGRTTRLGLGDTVLVPACRAFVTVTDATPDAELLVSMVPDPERDVRGPLLAAGHAPAAVAALSGPPGIAF